MKINKELEEKIIRMDITFTDEEYSLLMEHADFNMPFEETDRLKIEWALVDILKHSIDRAETNDEL